MKRVRVLLVDDSAAFRAALATALARDPSIEVVGQAGDGKQALALVKELQPDVVTMDVIMPVMDGLEAARAILAVRPTPILLMSNLARTNEQRLALSALRLGVVDAVNKPVLGGPDGKRGVASVIAQVKAAATVKMAKRPSLASSPSSAARRRRVALVAIAASTGGPPALEQVLAGLGESFPPVVVAQHLAASFTDGFVEWLAGALRVEVRAVDAPIAPRAGCVYVAAEGRHLRARPGLVEPVAAAAGELSPNADLLLTSAAEAYGASAIGVVLTGMGRDGAAGLRALRDAGAWTIAQDEASSVVYGMPRAAVEAGACSEVLPLSAIGPRLAWLAGVALFAAPGSDGAARRTE